MEKLSKLNEGWKNYGPKVKTYEDARNFVSKIYYDILDKIWVVDDRKYSSVKEKLQDKYLYLKPFRFYEHLDDFLRNTPELPNGLYEAAHDLLHYDQEVCDLFNMTEDEYKTKHPQKYKDIYGNNDDEKISTFLCADCGRRTPFQLQQDVIASSIFEDLLVSYSSTEKTSQYKGFRPNENATGRNGNKKVSSSCDLIYSTPPGYKEQIEIPIEIKTKWKDDYEVSMRGVSTKEVQKQEGMVLAIYMNKNQAVLIDFGGENKNKEFPKGTMAGDKDCNKINVNPKNFIQFCFWKEEDMQKVLNMIYTTYKGRETK